MGRVGVGTDIGNCHNNNLEIFTRTELPILRLRRAKTLGQLPM